MLMALNLCVRGAPDPHTPNLGSLLQVIPRELARKLSLKLIVEGLGVVIVDQEERLTGMQLVERFENQRMA
jgi:hypothetical protein